MLILGPIFSCSLIYLNAVACLNIDTLDLDVFLQRGRNSLAHECIILAKADGLIDTRMC